ncbi:hypothetical protein HAX54_008459 [Datura stramonium]|uniref:Uncharacterized protein n=1 Tax=Datura stramonium TaxID=4076 RepID=A0ABS8TER0_DATST|nr:hypothetical protein [Datura stramonium]
MDRCIGSWVCIEDPTFRSSFNDRGNGPLLTTMTRTDGHLEIEKGWQLRDESESDSFSGSESDEGSDEAEYDGDNPPADNARKDNDDAEESGDDDTNAEESGDKDSAAEETNEQVEDSEPGTTPKARVRVIPVDISERTITRVLMGGEFTLPTRTTEYDYYMEAMKGIRKLRTKDKVFHLQWMANIIAEDKEGAEWVTGRKRSTRIL